jgi:hypothetical protein
MNDLEQQILDLNGPFIASPFLIWFLLLRLLKQS